jgi:hypothetical protein
MTLHSSLLKPAVAIAGSALLLSACGSDGSESSSDEIKVGHIASIAGLGGTFES